MTYHKDIANRFKQARKESGMTQQELADSCGVTRDAIAKIETGHIKHVRGIEKISTALDVSPAWLQFGIESFHQSNSIESDFKNLTADQQETVRNLIAKYSEINAISALIGDKS